MGAQRPRPQLLYTDPWTVSECEPDSPAAEEARSMASIPGQQNSGSIGRIFAMNVEQEVVGLDHQR